MNGPLRSRRLMALFAAYVVALQGLLLPLAATAFAAPDFVLCSAARDAGSETGGRDTRDGGCAFGAGCGIPCSAPTLGGPSPALVGILRVAQVINTTLPPAPSAAVRTYVRHRHSPRAPPMFDVA